MKALTEQLLREPPIRKDTLFGQSHFPEEARSSKRKKEQVKSFTSYLWLWPTIGSLTDTWLEPLAISKLATGKEGIDSRSPCALQPESDSLSKHLRWAKRKES